MEIKDFQYILFSYCINFPILVDNGFSLRKPIALVGPCDFVQVFASRLSMAPVIGDISSSPIRMKESAHLLNSEAFIMDCSLNYGRKQGKVQQNLSMLFQAARQGVMDDIELCAATFVLFEKKIPQELQDSLYVVHIREYPSKDISDLKWGIPLEEDIPQIIEELIKHRLDWTPLRAAVQFLAPALKRHNQLDYFDHLCKVASVIDDAAESYDEAAELVECFIDAFTTYYEKMQLQLFFLPDLPALECNDFMESLFYKQGVLYMSEVLFKRIVEPLTYVYHIDLIKSLLASAGILEGNHSGYTSKMGYKVDGKFGRIRMMKLNIKQNSEIKSLFLYNGRE